MEEELEQLKLKALRERAGITQRELAQRTDNALSAIGYWESGKKIPSLQNAIAIAKELGISLKTLSKSLGLDVTGVPDDLPGENQTNSPTE